MNKLTILILVALILCALFYGLTFLNLPWSVILYSGNAVNAIVSLILGFCLAYFLYIEKDDDER